MTDVFDSAKPPEVRRNADGSFTITMTASPEMLARIAYGMYAEGSTHAEVTAWFEAHCPRYRALVVEVHTLLEDGTWIVRWAERPRAIHLSLESPITIESGPPNADDPRSTD